MQVRRRFLAIMLAALALAASSVLSVSAADRERSCRDVRLPVALTAAAPAEYTVFGRLCEPADAQPSVVQLLLSGLTYDHTYWDLPSPPGQPPGRQSYVASANDAGMATLALDRIGTGRSSQPLGLAVTIDSNAFVAHQVVQALRHGPLGEYQRVALVAHSYGSWTAWYESSRYRDVDVAVFSGISHGITPTAYARLLPRFFPAPLDAQLRGRVHDLTYLTSQPGERYTMFHAPGPVDPSLLAYDEAHKTTVTAGEIDNFPLILTQPLDIRAPVLLANSTLDPLFCGLLAADCSTAERLVATEGPYLGPDVPSIGGFVLPGAGHDLNYAPNAPSWFETAQRWIARHTG